MFYKRFKIGEDLVRSFNKEDEGLKILFYFEIKVFKDVYVNWYRVLLVL